MRRLVGTGAARRGASFFSSFATFGARAAALQPQSATRGWRQRRFSSSADGGGVPPDTEVTGLLSDAIAPSVDFAATTTSVAVAAAPTTFFESPSYALMQGIDLLHSSLNVPYWEAIVLVTLAVRVAMVPMSVLQIKTTSQLAVIKPEIDRLKECMVADPDKSSERVKHYNQEMSVLFQKSGFKPMRMWLPFLQLPVFVGFFMAIKDMGNFFPGYKTGGALWFQDLAASDPTYVLPILNGASMLLMFETGMANSPQSNKEQAEIMRWVMRAASVAMIPLMISMPNGLFVHWGVNNIFTMTQTAILSRDDVKAFMGIPKIPTPPAAPIVTPPVAGSPFLKLYEENQRLAKKAKEALAVKAKEVKEQAKSKK